MVVVPDVREIKRRRRNDRADPSGGVARGQREIVL
jgi:hypothetical protein